MSEQPRTEAPEAVVYFTDVLESASQRGRQIALCHNDTWYSGIPATVSSGVLVLERPGRYVLHLRIADVSAIREYTDADGAP